MAKLRVDKIAAPIVQDEFTGSVFFDGNGDYLEVDLSTDAIGTEEFTIEMWIYPKVTSDSNNRRLIRIGPNNNANNLQILYNAGSSKLEVDNGTNELINPGATALSTESWSHVALIRQGTNNLKLFVNGVLDATATTSADISQTTVQIGDDSTLSNLGFTGYISNLRICKGHAVYTDNFTPPTRELPVHKAPPKGVVFPAADNVTVLLACQDAYNPLTDASGRHTITGAGNLGGVPGQNLVTNGQFTQNTNDWAATIVSGSISFTRDTTVFSGGGIRVITGGGQSHVTQTLTGLVVGARYTFSADLYTPSSNPGTDVATISIVNAGYTSSNAVSTDTNGVIQRKSFTFTASSTSQVIYLSVVRANYSTFAPGGSVGHFDNISVIVVTPTTEANPGLLRKTNVTSTIAENTGSVYFDGGDDGLRSTPYDELTLGTGALTIECWFWRQNITDTWQVLVADNLYQSAGGWSLYTNTDDIYFYKGGAVIFTVSNCYSAQTWTHIAVQRDSGGRWSCYINGIDQGVSATDGVDFTDNRICIGTSNYNSNYPNEYNYKGYISNVRICKGHTVYKSNFTPPTTELEVHPETVLLACYDGENVFAEKTGKIIAANGGRTSSPTPTATDRPIGITTFQPELTREVDPVEGPTFVGGAGFVSQNWLTLPKGTTTERNPELSNAVSHGSARAIFGAIQVYPTAGNSIHYATIATFGNTVDFGDLVVAKRYGAGCASKTRGLFGGGSDPAPSPNNKQNSVSYITIATTGDSKDFGDLTTARWAPSAFSNATRGIWFSGNTSPANTNVIDYVTISTLGDALDFGDAFSARRYPLGSTSDTTRGIDAGGHDTSDNVIQYVTFASTGNAQDFGDLMQGIDGGCGGVSNGTRGVFAGGYTPTQVNTIQYITIQSMGNSKDFGDMTSTDARHGAAAESSIRGLFTHGGYPGRLNTIDAITIATTGNAVEFGDIIDIGGNDGGGDSGTQSGFSNGHGGLG